MKGYWHKLLIKMTFWLLAEIILTLVGLDQLADYGEFLLSENSSISIIQIQPIGSLP